MEEIPSVDHDWPVHPAGEVRKTEFSEFGPFRYEHERIRMFGGRERVVAVADAQGGILRPAGIHGDRIIGADTGAHLDQFLGDLEARRVAKVAGIRLEREAEQSDRPALQNVELFLKFLDYDLTLQPVDGEGGFEQARLVAIFTRSVHQ